MIKASFSRRGKDFSVEIKGHSYLAPVGEDIVCAAVSGGFEFLLAMLYKTNKNGIKALEKRKGFGKVIFSGGESEEGAYLMLYYGLMRLAEAYPERVRVNAEDI